MENNRNASCYIVYMPLLLAFIAIRLSILIVSETIKNQFSMTFFSNSFSFPFSRVKYYFMLS